MFYYSRTIHCFKLTIIALIHCFFILLSSELNAASSNFVGIDKVLIKNNVNEVFPYVINLISHTKGIPKKHLKLINKLKSNFVYISKVNVNKKIYIRLASGNFKHKKEASKALIQYIKYFKGAWINKRSDKEIQMLQHIIKSSPPLQRSKKKQKPVIKKAFVNNKTKKFAVKLLSKMEDYFQSGQFSKVITSANKVLEIGDRQQQQKAMELMGVARERQGKFAQAIAIYKEFLELFPKSPLSHKVNDRLIGLKTMRLIPKKRLTKRKPKRNKEIWSTHGSLSQYYRKDVIDNEGQKPQDQNSSLFSNLNYFARKNTKKTRLEYRFNGGLINDFLNNSTDQRISRASISYTNKEANFKIVSGRQSRTAKGVFGRFDGVVLTNYTDNINYSLFTGYPVLSSTDSINTNSQFLGGSINFKYLDDISTDLYLIQQDHDGLINRQAVGSQIQHINSHYFIYGLLDYDIFYHNLNNLTVISNYQYSEKWSFNITFDYRNSPFLTTLNALQGQAVTSLDELKESFSHNEIYNLAKDRTSKSTNLFISTSYRIDLSHQLYLSLSLNSTDATKSSDGILATPKSSNTYLSADYTIKNYFDLNDYSTIGIRLSQSTSSEVISIRSRTQFFDVRKIRYQPRFNIDYRVNKNTDLTQFILKPSLKIKYKFNKKISFESELGFEFSDFNLPEQDKQSSYHLFVGYLYQFY